jgi:imidazolonepropionase-like amidohydrolase
VWAHAALYPARPGEVVVSGVQVVSHVTLLAAEAAGGLSTTPRRGELPLVGPDHPAVARVIQAMRERGVMLEPTLRVFRVDPSLPDTAPARRREAQALALTRAAHRAGVRLVAGTDGMGSDSAGALPSLHDELELLVAAGLTPMQALVAATATAAQAAELAETHGTVAVGRMADLVILAADPSADIRNTRRIVDVLRRGVSVRRGGETRQP